HFVAYREWQLGTVSCSADGLPEESRDRAVLPGAPLLCLLARVGEETIPIALGSSKTLVPKRGGRLFVQANTFDWQACAGSVLLEIRGGNPAAEAATVQTPTRVEAAEVALQT